MANMTLAIPAELKAKMNKYPEINWSEVARQAIAEKTRTLEQMQQLLAHSTISEADAIEYGKEVKKRMWRKYRRLK